MKYRIVDIGELPIKITDFSLIRNTIIEELSDDEYILWKSDDEEHSQLLLKYLDRLEPQFPYYAIRRINLYHGKYWESANPDYSPHLVSNRVRYEGKIHERVKPHRPYGKIDYPIIHNHPPNWTYKTTRTIRPILAMKKALEVIRNQ